MISHTAEYALRAMTRLAVVHPRTQSTHELAENTGVPVSYLSKVMHVLIKDNLAHSHRGPYGGYALAKPPDRISLLDVLNAIGPLSPDKICPMARQYVDNHELCPLHRRMQASIRVLQNDFANITLAALAAEHRTRTHGNLPKHLVHPPPQ